MIDDYCDLPGFPDLTVNREQRIETSSLVHSGPDGLVYAVDHVRFTTVRTNVANGKTVTTKGRYTTRDAKVTDNGDGTFTVLAASTGSDQSYNSAGVRWCRTSPDCRSSNWFSTFTVPPTLPTTSSSTSK